MGRLIDMAELQEDGSWEIQGRRLEFPVRLTDAAAACAVYLVRTTRADRLVTGTGLHLVSIAGRTPLVLMLVDYRAGDLGTYAEVGVVLLARHRGRTGVYVHQLPVTGAFTLEAGRALWGLPKWPAQAEMRIDGRSATCHLADEGRHVLTAAIRTLPWRLPRAVPASLVALAPRADEVLTSPVRGTAGDIRVGFGGATVVLGSDHPMADELRAVGLPRRPLATATIGRLSFEMGPAESHPR
jgi:hypothetical protein